MALANLNQSFNIDPNTIKRSDPNYALLVKNLVNTFIGKSGISVAVKTPIPDTTMRQLYAIINTQNTVNSQVALQLNSLINQYIKTPAAVKSFIASNNMKYGKVNLQWNGRTMMWYLVQNQAIIDAAAQIQTMLAGRTSYKLI